MIEVLDLRLDNPLLRLGHSPCQIAGSGFIRRGQYRLAMHKEFLESYLHLSAMRLALWQPWLLVGHEAWQLDNRITRYNRYYRSIGKNSEDLPDGERCQEFCVTSANGLKFFSAIMLEGEWHDKVIQWLNINKASALIFSIREKHDEIVGEITKQGWQSHCDPFPSADLINDVCRYNIILFHFMGAFDDLEAGLVVIKKTATT
jgi:hypothetical protein